MSWVRWTIAIGAVVLLVSFAVGTEDVGHVRHQGQAYSCGDVLTFDHLSGGQGADETPAAVVAECRPIHLVHQAGVWGGIGLGALAILVGWTALRERENTDADPRGVLV